MEQVQQTGIFIRSFRPRGRAA